MEELYYVYTLSYPDGFTADYGTDLSGVVFYVGKGSKILGSFSQRLDDHEKEARSGGRGRKCDVIRSILAKGKIVGKSNIYNTASQDDALSKEMEFINGEYKTPYLTNIRQKRDIPRAERVQEERLPRKVDILVKDNNSEYALQRERLPKIRITNGLLDAMTYGSSDDVTNLIMEQLSSWE